MRKLKLAALLMAAGTILSLSGTEIANADWMQDSVGWWNTEGSENESWSVGWRYIDNEWYFFNDNGYMATGWVKDNGKWYFLYDDGAMAKDTSIDGYALSSDGSWIEDVSNVDVTAVNGEFTFDTLTDELKAKGYNADVHDIDNGILAAQRKVIFIGDDNLMVYMYTSSDEMEKDAALIDTNGLSYTIADAATNEATSTNFSWTGSPHFYKKGTLIVQYVGENNSLMSTLSEIMGVQFAGSVANETSSTESTDDLDIVKKLTYNQLSPKVRKLVTSFEDISISTEKVEDISGADFKDKSYIGKKLYRVEFKLNVDYVPNNMIAYVDMDSKEIVGYGLVD